MNINDEPKPNAEGSDAEERNRQSSSHLAQRTPKTKAAKKERKAPSTNKEPKKHKKWSIWRHFKQASRIKQLGWIGGGVGVITGLLVVAHYFYGDVVSSRHYTEEHRPKVIISRPPELLGTVECEITDKAIHLHTGAMRIYVKNIRKGDASGAFVTGPMFTLVPNIKLGIPSFDDLPIINAETCQQKILSKMKPFPVRGGEEVRIDMVQSAMTISLVKAKSVSATLGRGPEKEPETSTGGKEDRISIAKDALFQLYAPICVYYFDEEGATSYGSCRDYRFVVSGRTGAAHMDSFSCTQSPVSGTFEETFFGYCEN